MSKKEFPFDFDEHLYFFAQPKTWGEFKKVIASIPDDCPVQWVNQPPQAIYKVEMSPEERDGKNYSHYFVFQ